MAWVRHDDNWDVGVSSDMGTDRAEQRTGESAMAAGADNEEVGVDRAQAATRVTMEDVATDRDVGVTGQRVDPGEFVVHELSSRGVVVRVGETDADGDGRGLERVAERHGVAGPGMIDRPPEGGVRFE